MQFPTSLLKDQVALVTGASRGIGKGIASALAKAGAIVAGTATTTIGAKSITEYFQQAGLAGQGLVCNVNDLDSIEHLMLEIKKNYGAPHILVNNAGITADNLFLRMHEDQWHKVIDTNLTAVFRLSKACLRDMLKARSGRIINIGSVVGTTGNPGQANYCAAKAGLLGLTKALALEVGTRNITVNTVSPGYIVTDMTNDLSKDQQDNILTRIPMQRTGTVQDISAAVVFLASPWAGYITGQTLHVNGGMYMG